MGMKSPASGMSALLAGGVAAMLASTCCIGPLVLVLMGFGGAWVANLQVLEPYRPLLLGLALMFLVVAARRIWLPALVCTPDAMCAQPRTRQLYKMLFGLVALLVLAAFGFPYAAPFFY